MGRLTRAAEGIESVGRNIRDSISSAFSGSQRSTNNVNTGPMSSSPRPQGRPSGGISSLHTGNNSSRNNSSRNRSGSGGGSSTPAEPAMSAMSSAANAGSFVQPLNPNYDSSDPMSAKYASRPSYEELVAYRNTPSEHVSRVLPGSKFDKPVAMAEGGEVEPSASGNEVVDSAVMAVTGALTGQEAAIALALFVETYGKDELQKLVTAVGSRASDGEDRDDGGEVKGPGTGKSDSVDAKMGNKPYKLSNGEYILPVEVVEGLGDGDHDKGIATLDRLREMAQAGRPRENAMDPSA